MKKVTVIFIYLFHYSLQISTPEDDSYMAAVVECPLRKVCNVTESLRQYRDRIEQAAEKGADIIVFPEKTLNGNCMSIPVPMTGKNRIPADNPTEYSYILVALSKAARENNIYVVLNVQELLDCTVPQKGELCPEKRKYYFSTSIVFNRQGVLYFRTRKIHLFGEPFRTGSLFTDEKVYFDTDFGVKFVILINFDILFQVPQLELIGQKKVNNVIFTTAWYTEFPFLSAVQTQRSISNSLNINLLGANGNSWDRDGSGGSGIFSGKGGTLISLMRKIDVCRMLMAEVPKTPGMLKKKYPGPLKVNPAKQDDILPLTDKSLDKYLTRDLVPGYQVIDLAYQDITCKFIVNVTLGCGEEYYRYKAAAWSGVKNMVVNVTGGFRSCAIFACSGEDIDSCGKGFEKYSNKAIATFSELTVIGTLPNTIINPVTKLPDGTFFPTSLQTSLYSLQPDEIELSEENNGLETEYTLSLTNYDVELYVFGFYGRKFTDDGKAETTPLIENIVVQMNKGKYG